MEGDEIEKLAKGLLVDRDSFIYKGMENEHEVGND